MFSDDFDPSAFDHIEEVKSLLEVLLNDIKDIKAERQQKSQKPKPVEKPTEKPIGTPNEKPANHKVEAKPLL